MKKDKSNRKTERSNNPNLPFQPKGKLKVMFLGGVGEIGKNMTAFEYNDSLVVIDAGVTFPSNDMPGVDMVIPDMTYLAENKQKLKAVLLTHGHEDHIGGIPFLLQVVNIPFIYATPLACAMITRKLEEKRLTNKTKLIRINDE